MQLEISPKYQSYIESIPWIPQEGPQTDALLSKADVLLYGGAAGGGKSSLACGAAITRHEKTLIMRREATQMKGILNEIAKIIDPDRTGYSGHTNEWRIPEWDGRPRTIMLGSCKDLGNETKWQGIERDLLVLDEAANFLEAQAKFLMGWTRSTTSFPGGKGLYSKQRTRCILASNPPTSSEGGWLIEMFAAWLDPMHPNPAKPGDLRWYTTIGGVMSEVPNGDPIDLDGDMIYPKSFTFIPAKVRDNKYLGPEYLRELQALPEPLRSQMLLGDWTAGRSDAERQVIPSAWVEAAMQRWVRIPFDPMKVTSSGLDPSRGGNDDTVLAMRQGWHYHDLNVWPGREMVTGKEVTANVLEILGHSMCPIHIDVIGIGASVYDLLTMHISSRAVPCNAAESGNSDTDWSNTLKFTNKRASLWWRFRDLLNPDNGYDVSLPPIQRLKAELCAPTFDLIPSGIKVESKKDIQKRLGKSTDYADAVIMAAERAPGVAISGIAPVRTTL